MRIFAAFSTVVLSAGLNVAVVLANAPAGDKPPDYSGISYMYYTLIILILGYGVYDTFIKKS
jgi:hypothetical protein